MNSEESYKKALNYALYIITGSDKTTAELRTKLEQKQYEETIVEAVVAKLIELKYLDDEKYVRNWLNYYGKQNIYSKRQMIYKLQQKGLDRNRIDQALEEIEIDERIAIEKIIEKRCGEEEVDAKTIRYLMNRGFSYAIVKDIAEERKRNI